MKAAGVRAPGSPETTRFHRSGVSAERRTECCFVYYKHYANDLFAVCKQSSSTPAGHDLGSAGEIRDAAISRRSNRNINVSDICLVLLLPRLFVNE